MCARFTTDMELIVPAIQRVAEVPQRSSGDVFPGRSALTLANSRSLQPRCFDMKWGFSRPDGSLIINARSETAAEKPLFSAAVARHRCLVPTTGYYEWQHRDNGSKTRFLLQPYGEPVFFLAGIYRMEETGPVFTLLTGEPLPAIEFIHPRMPMLLPVTAATDWLDLNNDWREVLRDLAPRDMEFRET